ncbi:MAG: HU family DNA-binding protein [Prevotella sp.]
MTKLELAEQVSGDTGFSKEECEIIITSLVGVLRKYIKMGTNIDVRGLGVFKRKLRKEKKGYDILRKKQVIIKEHYIPYFNFASDLKEEIQNEGKEE